MSTTHDADTGTTTCINDCAPAETVVLHDSGVLGAALCAACATCTDPICGEAGTILDPEYDEPWCAHHAAQFTGEEAVLGPALVPVTDPRVREAMEQEHGR